VHPEGEWALSRRSPLGPGVEIADPGFEMAERAVVDDRRVNHPRSDERDREGAGCGGKRAASPPPEPCAPPENRVDGEDRADYGRLDSAEVEGACDPEPEEDADP